MIWGEEDKIPCAAGGFLNPEPPLNPNNVPFPAPTSSHFLVYFLLALSNQQPPAPLPRHPLDNSQPCRTIAPPAGLVLPASDITLLCKLLSALE